MDRLSVTLALGAAVLSSFGWVALDTSRKALALRASPPSLLFLLSVGQLVCFGFGALWGESAPTANYLRPGVISVASNAAANLLFLYALTLAPLGRTAPLLALSPVFAALTESLFLKESLRFWQWAGVLLITASSVSLAVVGSTNSKQLRGAIAMVVVAACWAVSAAADKVAIHHATVYVHGSIQAAGCTLLAFAWLAVNGRTGEVFDASRHWRLVVAGVALGVAALALQLVALQALFASLVEAIKRALGVVGAVVSGRLFFSENVDRKVWGACGLLCVGVFLLL